MIWLGFCVKFCMLIFHIICYRSSNYWTSNRLVNVVRNHQGHLKKEHSSVAILDQCTFTLPLPVRMYEEFKKLQQKCQFEAEPFVGLMSLRKKLIRVPPFQLKYKPKYPKWKIGQSWQPPSRTPFQLWHLGQLLLLFWRGLIWSKRTRKWPLISWKWSHNITFN